MLIRPGRRLRRWSERWGRRGRQEVEKKKHKKQPVTRLTTTSASREHDSLCLAGCRSSDSPPPELREDVDLVLAQHVADRHSIAPLA